MDEPWRTLGGLAAGAALTAGGASLAVRSLLQPLRPCGVPVFRLGLVGPPRAGSPLNDLRVPPSRFEPFLRNLSRRGFRAVTLAEAARRRRERDFLASRPVALTFDGPFLAFRAAAWPALRRHGLTRVTLFFPAARLGQESLTFAEGRPEPILSTEDLATLVGEGVEVGLWTRVTPGEQRDAVAARLRQERAALSGATGAPVVSLAAAAVPPALEWAARAVGFECLASDGHGFFGAQAPAFGVPRFAVTPKSTPLELALVVGRRVGVAAW